MLGSVQRCVEDFRIRAATTEVAAGCGLHVIEAGLLVFLEQRCARRQVALCGQTMRLVAARRERVGELARTAVGITPKQTLQSIQIKVDSDKRLDGEREKAAPSQSPTKKWWWD